MSLNSYKVKSRSMCRGGRVEDEDGVAEKAHG